MNVIVIVSHWVTGLIDLFGISDYHLATFYLMQWCYCIISVPGCSAIFIMNDTTIMCLAQTLYGLGNVLSFHELGFPTTFIQVGMQELCDIFDSLRLIIIRVLEACWWPMLLAEFSCPNNCFSSPLYPVSDDKVCACIDYLFDLSMCLCKSQLTVAQCLP